MTDSLRIAVIVYGSLLHPAELGELFDGVDERTTPVRVDGFVRRFDQEASWRETDGNSKAVLNVVRSEDSWFNGVLVADLTRSELQAFRSRERGYRLVTVEDEQLEPSDTSSELPARDLVLTTTGKKRRDDIRPIDSYVERCRAGAAEWGETFLRDFDRTTERASGESRRASE